MMRLTKVLSVSAALTALAPATASAAPPDNQGCPAGFLPTIQLVSGPPDNNADGIICSHARTGRTIDNNLAARNGGK